MPRECEQKQPQIACLGSAMSGEALCDQAQLFFLWYGWWPDQYPGKARNLEIMKSTSRRRRSKIVSRERRTAQSSNEESDRLRVKRLRLDFEMQRRCQAEELPRNRYRRVEVIPVASALVRQTDRFLRT
jgi:hypothetical protein